jgi:hypothetical protein
VIAIEVAPERRAVHPESRRRTRSICADWDKAQINIVTLREAAAMDA